MSDTAKYNLISADAHVLEPKDLFEGRLPAHLQDRAPRLERWSGGSAWMVDGAAPVPLPVSAATGSGYRAAKGGEQQVAASIEEMLPSLYDPAERLKAQDADSVDAEVIYPYPGLWDAIRQLEDAELRLGCVRAYNDWIAEFSSHSPDRLVGLGKIPTGGPENARNELLRCVQQLKLRGVILDAWPGGSPIPGDPAEDPFWDTVNDTAVPVSIHYAVGPNTSTSAPSGVAATRHPPMAEMALPLVETGLFDRCPNVRLVLAHGNAGWVSHWLEFLDSGYIRSVASRKYTLQDPEALPSDYIRRHFWFTFNRDRTAVRARHQIGVVNLLWASHFPLDSADWPDDRRQAMQVTEEIAASEQRALLADNTARLYQLPGYAQGFEADPLSSFEKLVHL